MHSVPSDFKNYKSMNIPVHVAKKGAVMQAIGVGDIDLHSVDNMGNPCVLTLKDVLCIPEANKSLISMSMLAKEGYQCVTVRVSVPRPGVSSRHLSTAQEC